MNPMQDALPSQPVSDAMLQQIVWREAGEAILIVDPEHDRIVAANPAACRLLNYPNEELLDTPISAIHPRELDVFRAFVRSVYRHGEACTRELNCFTKDGRVVPAEVIATRCKQPWPNCMIALVRDISERQAREAEWRRARDELERSADRLSDTAASWVRCHRDEHSIIRHFDRTSHAWREEPTIIGDSHAMRMVLQQLAQVAVTDCTVLITGETGTGKELVAKALHADSRRRHRPLVRVNCAAIPHELFESEFFGHIKGAFTGAHCDRMGRFEMADGGTLFLDEVGEIPLELQGKLLSVLQDQQFERIGDGCPRNVDVRIVAATNRDLQQAVAEQRFRSDLYYRLNVFPIHLPPLRERREDIPLLVEHLLAGIGRRLGRTDLHPDPAAEQWLQTHDWPGNVRELHNLLERAAVITPPGDPLGLHVPLDAEHPHRSTVATPTRPSVMTEAQRRALDRKNILAALERTGGRIAGACGAARLLGIKPTTLRSRMKALGIRFPVGGSQT